MRERKVVIVKRVRLIVGSKMSRRIHTQYRDRKQRHTNTWLTRT